MAKQTINVGTTANDRKGDSLRAAFQKVNANFTELYTALGLATDVDLNLGNFVFEENTIRLTNSTNDDSTATTIEIAQPVRIESDLTVGGDILPNNDLSSTLGSPTKKFHSVYVGEGSVYLGDAKLSLENGKLQSSVGFNLTGSVGEVSGAVQWDNVLGKPTFATVATSGSYDDLTDTPTIPSITGLASETYVDEAIAAIPATDLTGLATETYVDEAVGAITIPVDISDLTDTGNLLTNVNTGDFTFNGNILSTDVGMSLELNSGSLDISIDEYLWQFTDSGSLSFPGSTASIYGDANTLELFADTNSNNGIGISSSETRVINSGSVKIISDTDSDEHTWTFGSDGGLTFPDATVQTTAYTGSENTFDQTLNTTDGVTFASLSIVPQSEEDSVDLGTANIINAGSIDATGVNTPSINNAVANEGLTLSATWETITPNQELIGNDNQGGVTNDLISVWVSGSDPVFPEIVNVQAGWTVNGTGLEDGVVTDTELLDLGSGLVIYRMTIDTASEKNGYTYTFTEPPTVETGVRSWAFGSDGSLEFPGGAILDTQGSMSNGDFNITIPGDIAGSPQLFRFTDEGGSGALVFPDGTFQSTAFLGGAPNELNDDENGNKLILDSAGNAIFTDSDGTLETPSGGGVDRGIFWDFGVTAGGTDSYIKQTEGGLWIHPYTTEPEHPFSDSGLNILVGDPEAETPTVWKFESTGGVRFPDDTVQTTAYPGQQLEIDGGNAFTVHSIADLEIDGGGA